MPTSTVRPLLGKLRVTRRIVGGLIPVRSWRFFLSGRWGWLFALLFLGLVVPLLLTTWFSLHLQRKAIDDAYRFEMDNMVNILAEGMRDPIWNLTPNSGAALIESVLEDPRVISVVVTSHAQQKFLSAERVLLPGEEQRTLERDVVRNGEKIGEVVLVVVNAERTILDLTTWGRIIVVGSIQLLLSVGIVVFVASVVRRLERTQILQKANDDLQFEMEERKRAEKALRESEERLSLTIRASGDGIWDWNIETGELFWSKRLMDIVGLKPDEFDPHISTFFRHLVRNDRERVSKALEAHFQKREPYDVRFRLVHVDGRLIEVAAKGQAAWDDEGRQVRMVGTVSDISELVRSNDLLLQTERLANIGNWHITLPSQQLTWSAETYRIQGFEPFEFDPSIRQAIACYHPEDRLLVEEAVTRAIENATRYEFDARIVRPNGELRHVHCDGDVSTNDQGETIAVFGTIQDRTKQVEQERQLNQAQKMEAIGQLAGGVAHDFNNLLAVIMGNIELLEDEDDPEVRPELTKSALEAVLRGRDLTSSLLNFARSAPLQPKRIELFEMFAELRVIIRRTLPASQEITIDIPTEIWPIEADPANLEACILNLALNARDAMPNGGHLRIVAKNLIGEVPSAPTQGDLEAGPYVVLEVSDTGCGIAKKDIDRVFEPFFTTKPVGKGTGLGLSRVRGFAEQSGGTVHLESNGNTGTKIQIVLPASVIDSSFSAKTSMVPSLADLPKARILLVEDMDDVRITMERRLKADGYDVVAAESGDAAFELFTREEKFDVLITDVSMPGNLQGTDLASRIKAAQPNIGVVYFSGHPKGALDGIKANGSDVFLSKPVSRNDLYSALDRILNSRFKGALAGATTE